MPVNSPVIDQQLIATAVSALQDGLLVAFPTETVYGLGADAGNVSAIKRLYAAKGRPANHPVIVHIYELAQLGELASSIPAAAQILAQRFWPGPLTLVLPRTANVLDEVTGGQDTVAVRIPDHPMALELLRAFGKPVVAPSANRFGRLSPTTAADVQAEFQDQIAVVLDGGQCTVGLESTIVDLSSREPVILRPGMILKEEIEEALGIKLGTEIECSEFNKLTGQRQGKVRVPGSLPSHYAPSTPLEIVFSDMLSAHLHLKIAERKKFSVLAFSNEDDTDALGWLVADKDPYIYAHDLYKHLHHLDNLHGNVIIVEQVPNEPKWAAIRDRLQRAAAVICSSHDLWWL